MTARCLDQNCVQIGDDQRRPGFLGYLLLLSMAENVDSLGQRDYWREGEVAEFYRVGTRTIENWMARHGG